MTCDMEGRKTQSADRNLQDARSVPAYRDARTSSLRRVTASNPNPRCGMRLTLTATSLALETAHYRGTGGVSENNRSFYTRDEAVAMLVSVSELDLVDTSLRKAA